MSTYLQSTSSCLEQLGVNSTRIALICSLVFTLSNSNISYGQEISHDQKNTYSPKATYSQNSGSGSIHRGSGCTSPKPAVYRGFGPIGLVNQTKLPDRVLEEAIGYWRRCDSYGKGFPSFIVDGPKTVNARTKLEINYLGTSNSMRCASIQGHIITLYSFARRPSGQKISCGDPAQNLAHELGHFLGLNHAVKQVECNFNIMATIKPRNARRRRVVQEECQAVDQRWLTAFETLPLSRSARVEPEQP